MKICRPIKKVLLVNPPLSGEERYGELALGGVYMPPLGLAILAAVLRKEGYEPIILDCEALGLRWQKALDEISSLEPDLVGITAVTMAIYSAAELAGLIKQHMNIPIVIGGVHITAMPEDTMLRFPCFDYGVYGEGEVTLPDLLMRLCNGSDMKGAPGILYRKDGSIVKNPQRPYIKNLDEIPFPAWDLLPNLTKYYKPSVFGFKRLPSMSIITSRGCSGKCTFCYHSLFGNLYRFHSAEYVVGMIQHLMQKYGIRNIDIYDDTFAIARTRLQQFCRLIIKRELDIVWSANSRVNLVNPEMLALMKRAGCWLISYGIETGDQRILDSFKKGITLEQVTQAIRWSKEVGIKTRGFIMVGTMAETKESIEKTHRFLLNLPLDLVTINHYTPFPGSEDYTRIRSFGTYVENWQKLNQHSNVFVPHGLTSEIIENAITKMTRSFYLRPHILWHFLCLMMSPLHSFHLLKGAIAFIKFAFIRGTSKNN